MLHGKIVGVVQLGRDSRFKTCTVRVRTSPPTPMGKFINLDTDKDKLPRMICDEKCEVCVVRFKCYTERYYSTLGVSNTEFLELLQHRGYK